MSAYSSWVLLQHVSGIYLRVRSLAGADPQRAINVHIFLVREMEDDLTYHRRTSSSLKWPGCWGEDLRAGEVCWKSEGDLF